MIIPLRQSTASQEIIFGRAVDSTDGNTEETGLTIANTDIKLWRQGATTLASKNSGGATHIANGMYSAVLDATDSATLGALQGFVHVAGALPMRFDCVVYPAAIYDAIWGGSGNIPVDVATVQTDAITAAAVKADAVTKIGVGAAKAAEQEPGTAQAGAAGTITLASTASAVDDYYNGRHARVHIRQGTGAGQDRPVTDYVGSTKVASVAPDWVTHPDATSVYDITFV